MARPSKIGAFQELLESYLDGKDAAWTQQDTSKERRVPTLPQTSDGKVNVRALARELQEFAIERGEDANRVPDSAWQYFYKHEPLAEMVDLIASEQGLAKIASRTRDDAKDDASSEKISRLNKCLKGQAEGHAQSRVRVTQLERDLANARAENDRLRERLGIMQRTGLIVRTGDTTH
ncbi:hypothetical protein [Microvirga guangxiensis]|uniref:Uncharacterized protein n=1 Tax=Microvirga guangxiensis TaxID=549386 RepID=A0A1G5HQS5_9HYPH|nr:hypothetical protein [Microvirga guangxiensis]SCY65640.1 hypothetical protein SAMN02927923_01848 [Microvirga guangxiensis]